MARGGYRPGAGRPKGSKGAVVAAGESKTAIKKAARKAGLSPLDYMLAVMNNPEADQNRRDRMAVAAAPFVHPRVADNRFGKRDEESAAADRAAVGKFAPPEAPKLVVNNG